MENKNNLSKSWKIKKLGSLCNVVRGGSPRPMGDPKYFKGNIPFIKISDITKDDSKIVFDSITKVNSEGVKKSRLLKKGSLILSNSGTICIPKFLGVDACIHDGFVSFLDISNDLSIQFLYHYFDFVRPFVIQKYKQGITQVNLNTEIVKDFDIPVPLFDEQQQIVNKIEELFSEIDNGVATLRNTQAQLKTYRQAVLKSAYEGKLTHKNVKDGELPEGWKISKLPNYVKIVSGNTPKGLEKISNKGELPFYKVADMNREGNEVFLIDSNIKLSHSEINELKIKLFPKGTVVFPKRGGAILTNKKRILSQNSSFDLNIMGLIPHDNLLSIYLYYWMLKLDLSQIFDGSNVPQINSKNIEPLQIPICIIEEQKQVVSEIKARFIECDNLETEIEKSLIQSEQLKQSVLKKAFEGKLV